MSGIRTQVTVSPQAGQDIRRFGSGAKDALGDFVRRLRADRTNRSLRLRALREAGDNGQLFTAALDGDRMVLLLETEQNRFGVLALREGPQAHEELARLTVEVNRVSGGIELVDQAEVSANVVTLPERSAEAPPADEAAGQADDTPSVPTLRLLPPLFGRYDDETLINLGVIAPLLPAVKRLTTEGQLLALVERNIPELTKDILLALHGGMEPDDVQLHITDQWQAGEQVDQGDWARAARRPVSQVSTEDAAVLDALGQNFDAWRLFLHPEQQRLATTEFKGSAKVTGGPGTGKTVVALHRMRYLVDRLPRGHGKAVLLTTFNTNLAADLTDRLRQLGGPDLLNRVDIKSVDLLAREVIEQQPGADIGRPIDDTAALQLWHTVCTELGEYEFDAEFLDSEWKHVVLAQGCGSVGQYLRAARPGRKVIQRPQRLRVWQLVEAYVAKLAEPPRRITYAQIADRAAHLEEQRMSRVTAQAQYKEEHGGIDLIHREAGSGMWLKPRYQHIVVDEAQDLSASHWRMLRAMVAPGANDIFLVGDAHQRIYAHQVVLGRLGIRTPGRSSRRLTLNYRTTRQILGSAHGLIEGEAFDDLDDGHDSLDGYRSVLSGLAPQFYRAPDWETEMRAVATLIKQRHDEHGTPYEAMAVSVPDGSAATQMAVTLARDPFRIPVSELGKDGPRSPAGVRIGTMYRFKGLEFQRVFLTSVSEGQVPRQRLESCRISDPKRYAQELQRSRSLLFVAATRARDELVVTWNGRASRFLPRDADSKARSATELLSGGGSAAVSVA
ncbi:UvrD-helicase domain-containing protein [Streptomyces sp. N35]|uniref:UvrD-helicase domain-containing protein n=1 Tax=Streptomyces sp. N35 TaxID=2795730 RepID=UPI0018F52098|nr:UvrD-helicase domain-containing protein [Streptomyces sp. N35]